MTPTLNWWRAASGDWFTGGRGGGYHIAVLEQPDGSMRYEAELLPSMRGEPEPIDWFARLDAAQAACERAASEQHAAFWRAREVLPSAVDIDLIRDFSTKQTIALAAWIERNRCRAFVALVDAIRRDPGGEHRQRPDGSVVTVTEGTS